MDLVPAPDRGDRKTPVLRVKQLKTAAEYDIIIFTTQISYGGGGMAYCKSCGAYIPDGQTKCLACGYDEAAQAAQEQARPDNTSGQTDGAAAGAYQNAFAYRDNHEDLKHRLEEQRRAQQEAQRRLAEQEYARRKKQEEDRRWAQQEYERRQEEKRRQEQENANRFAQDAARYTYRSQTSAQPNKMLAALSYLGVLCILPYLFTENDSFAKFHAGQGVRLLIFGLVGTVVGSIIGLGWLFTLASLYFVYKGMSNALNGKMEPLPWIGTIGSK